MSNDKDNNADVCDILDPTNADLQKQIHALNANIAALTASVGELTNAWNSAKGITGFVKWTAGVAASVAVVWAAIHGSKPE